MVGLMVIWDEDFCCDYFERFLVADVKAWEFGMAMGAIGVPTILTSILQCQSGWQLLCQSGLPVPSPS
jgi:hypothetical protein